MAVGVCVPRVEARDLRPEVPPEQSLVISSAHKASFLVLDVSGLALMRSRPRVGADVQQAPWRRLFAWQRAWRPVPGLTARGLLTRARPCPAPPQWAAGPAGEHQALALTLQKPLLVAELRWASFAVFLPLRQAESHLQLSAGARRGLTVPPCAACK